MAGNIVVKLSTVPPRLSTITTMSQMGRLKRRMGDYFSRYKRDEPGMFSRVPGWGSVADGLELVKTTRAFFLQCRERAGSACQVEAP